MSRPRSIALLAAAALACGPDDSTSADATGTDGTSAASATNGSAPPTSTTDSLPESTSSGPSTSTGATDTTAASEETTTTTDGGAQPCDLWQQNCPAGEKCVAHADGGLIWNSTKCVPVVKDPAQAGEEGDAHPPRRAGATPPLPAAPRSR